MSASRLESGGLLLVRIAVAYGVYQDEFARNAGAQITADATPKHFEFG
jgi:hypothetical protein